MFYAANAIIPPPDSPSFHTRAHRVFVDSALRDLERWPSAACFSVDLAEPLLDVMSIRLTDAHLPSAAPRNVREGANELVVEETVDDGAPVVSRVAVRPGAHEREALAAALRAALRAASTATEVDATWDPAGGHCVLRTSMRDAAGRAVVTRLVSPSDPAAYQRSLARAIGLARGDATRARQTALARGADLAETSRGAFAPPAGGGGGATPDDPVVVFYDDAGGSRRSAAGRLGPGGAILVPDAEGAGVLRNADVWRAEIRPDHRAPDAPARPVLHLNGFRRIESPHDAYNASFAVLREGRLCADDAPAKHFNPPMATMHRLHLRLTDAWGDPYDLQNDDVAFEIEVTRMMPGARSSMANFAA